MTLDSFCTLEDLEDNTLKLLKEMKKDGLAKLVIALSSECEVLQQKLLEQEDRSKVYYSTMMQNARSVCGITVLK